MAITDTPRPKWNFNLNFQQAKWLRENRVTTIVYDYEDEDNETRNYLACLSNGEKNSIRVPDIAFNSKELTFICNHRGLIELRKDISNCVGATLKWDEAHKRERREYERLKKKFGDAT